ncbi:reverse transcriptase [Gossypium australe]|uniref:Reverse transcriptase n=1 Tax=Gossypium australe TaxID=47621 RepID=A0A5B6VDS1_9ROSI|nr:reverse transcriptase [Gossypium australe]
MTRICLSRNTMEDRDLVTPALVVQSSLDLEKYLVLPITVGRNKKRVFQSIKDKIQERINGCLQSNPFARWQGGIHKVDITGYSHVYSVLFLTIELVL